MSVANDKAIIKISGIDATKFLQGQITVDVTQLVNDLPCLAAHCNPQGRIISLFYIVLHQNDYYLFLPTEMASLALQALKKYAIFFKATLEMIEKPPANVQIPTKLSDIAAGVPAIYVNTSTIFLPHELNLPSLNAVSFNKGCYTGQEIIARMQYRGKLKKHLYRGSLATGSILNPGSDLFYQNDHSISVGATVVDSILTDTDEQQILLVTDETHAKDHHLFMTEGNPIYVTFCK